MKRRFGALKKLIVETVVDNDALLLGDRREASTWPNVAGNARSARRYDFPSDPAGKVEAFLDWLMQAVDDEILEVTYRDGRRIVARNEWQNVYVRAGYGRGIDHGSAALRRAGIEVPQYSLGAVFGKPIHADALGMLFVRNFNELRGITEAMGQEIARVLAEGLAMGLGPREVARMIVERVDKVGLTRAVRMARTEIIRAHAEATLNRFEEFGVKGVNTLAEWSTSGDDRVCELCQGREGKTYTIAEARGMLPLHPNCRCAWLPVIERAK